MFVVHTSNCHGQNCTRLAIYRLGIDVNCQHSSYVCIQNVYVCFTRWRCVLASVDRFHIHGEGRNSSACLIFPVHVDRLLFFLPYNAAQMQCILRQLSNLWTVSVC